MAKFCKFCNYENEDKEEFCSKCGAKLPSYLQYEAGLMDEMKSAKKHFFHFNFALIIKIAVLIAIAVMLIHFIKPSSDPEKLPDYRSNQKAVRNLISFNNRLHEQDSIVGNNLMTNPAALSLYLTSFIAPDAINLQKSSPDILPRIIVKTPDDLKKITLVRYSKFYILPISLELNFKQYNSDIWHLDTWKFCNFPLMSFAKDTIWEYAVKDLQSNPKMKKIFSPDFHINRTKLYIVLTIVNTNNAQNAVKKINSCISDLLNPIQKFNRKTENIAKNLKDLLKN